MGLLDPLGIDVASVNGNVDWKSIPGLAFGAARCGVSWGWKDPQYDNNRAQAEALEIPFIAYHVLYPGQPIKAQMDNFIRCAGKGCWGYSWDLELECGMSPSRVNADSRDATAAMQDAGYNVINYSRPYWIMEHFGNPVPAWVNTCYWWLATYTAKKETEHPGPLSLPKGMKPELVLIHQSWDRMPSLGKAIDVDRWIRPPVPTNGTRPVPKVLTLEEKVDILVEGHPTLF